jgi:DNA processing protein
MTNLRPLLALNRLEKVGPRTVFKLLEKWPDLNEMFHLPIMKLEQAGLPSWLAYAISQLNLDSTAIDMEWLNTDENHTILTWDSPKYPSLLKEIHNPPFILYAKGQLSSLEQPQIAIVGSRTPSITGSENAKQFSRELASRHLTIVSGLALGIDAQAHIGCLEAKGKTIAVLGTGIDTIYPRRHKQLAEQICKNGLILSEFPLNSPPIAGHFPRRNRIISGLSLCILVIEAAIKSGSLITAKMALEQNRDVLAIPGSIHNPMARGCHYLLQQGAKLVTSVHDVLEELNLEEPPTGSRKSDFPLASEKENLVKFIGFETTTIDQMIERSGYSIEQVTNELAELELQGMIAAIPGGYTRCKYER